MRLKSLRKERPAFEIEGAVINGSRMDLSKSDLKPTKQRSNASFVLPTSLNIESSPVIILSSDQTHEMNTRSRSRQKFFISTASQPSNLPSYPAIETAYLKHGIRICLSPTRTGQQSGRQSVNSFQRRTPLVNRNRNRSRASSALHYTTNNLDQHQDYSRPFSALQQTSSDDFEQTTTHNVSYAQSSQMNEEKQDDYLSPSIIASEDSNLITPPEKIPTTNDVTSPTPRSFDDDPDFVYMSSLLKKPSGKAFLEIIRRRAGLRGTFAIHRRPLTANPVQSNEKSSNMNRKSSAHTTTTSVVRPLSSNKIDKDILKHASRIRKMTPSKDSLSKSPRRDTVSNATSPSKQNSTTKPVKSLSLEPLEFLLQPASRSLSLSTQELPLIKTPTQPRRKKTSEKRTKPAKVSIVENENLNNFLSPEHLTYSSVLRDESLALMKTSPLDMAPQSNSFDSGWYERSTSSVDVQSLTSSSNIQIQSSTPSAHRPNTNKKVSFYEEPSAVILTTATYA